MIISGMDHPPLASRAVDGALLLADWGLIRAAGADARSFLHAQLTQDVEQLPSGQARLAGYCSAKGRLLASFVFWRESDDAVLLACSADLLAPTLKRLSMFVLRARCKLTDASAERSLYGIAGPSALAAAGEAWRPAPGQLHRAGEVDIVRLPDVDGVPRALWVAPAGQAPEAPMLAAADWAALEVRSGVPRITAATVEQFVPQMVNLELVGGVNFRKGCYPGQEVVARSQYRGTLKRRAAVFASGQPLRPGDEVFDPRDPGQPAGRVVNAADASPALALVEVKLAALDGPPLRAGSAEGAPLQALALPYECPLDAD